MPDHPIPRMFKQLAESIVNPVERQKSVQHAIDIMEGRDPEVRPPMMDSGGMGGLTRGQAASDLLKKLYRPGLGEAAKTELGDALKLILKGLPKKSLIDINSIGIESPRGTYSDVLGARFGKHTGMGGYHDPLFGRIALMPVKDLKEALDLALPHSTAEVFGHESGHALTERMLGRLAKRFETGGASGRDVHHALYVQEPTTLEGLADAIGATALRKSGVAKNFYRPESGYGVLGEDSAWAQRTINAPPELGQNPYRNLKNELERLLEDYYPRKGQFIIK